MKKPRKVRVPVEERISNLLPSSKTELDWTYEVAVSNGDVNPRAALPPSVDLRAAWWEPGDQFRTASCVGWAVADGLARYHYVKAGKISSDTRLSPRVLYMAAKEADRVSTRPESFIDSAPTSIKAGLDFAKTKGLALETWMPFIIEGSMYEARGDLLYADMSKRKIARYYTMGKDFKKWRSWLATNGPIVIGFTIDNSWDTVGADGLLDVFKAPTRGGHAAVVVGYRADGRFIIRNSYGDYWGDKGFAYAKETYLSAAFLNECYGISI